VRLMGASRGDLPLVTHRVVFSAHRAPALRLAMIAWPGP
jgi:hypothetical protein